MLDIATLTALVTAFASLIAAIAAIVTIVLQGREIKAQATNLDKILHSEEKSRRNMDEVDRRMQELDQNTAARFLLESTLQAASQK
jgi:predicted PurR-regulated permease PerM